MPDLTIPILAQNYAKLDIAANTESALHTTLILICGLTNYILLAKPSQPSLFHRFYRANYLAFYVCPSYLLCILGMGCSSAKSSPQKYFAT